jgi:hypothetical protein
MPTVPIYNQQVQVQTPTVNSPLKEAFGGDVIQAKGQMAQAISNAGVTMSAIAKDMKDTENKKNLYDLDVSFRKDLANTLQDNSPDETGQPKGLLLKQQDQTKGITKQYNDSYTKLLDTYRTKAQEFGVDGQFERLAYQAYESNKNNVVSHEAAETRKAFVSSLNANINNRIDDAKNWTDANLLADNIVVAGEVLAEGMQKQGITDPAVIQEQQRKVAGNMAINAISSVIETDYKKAQEIFDKNKVMMDADSISKVDKVLQGQKDIIGYKQIWGEVSKFVNADGMPDLAKQEAYVRSRKLNPDQEEKTIQYIKARAQETKFNINAQRDSQTTAFMNELVKTKQAGATMDQALKLATKYQYSAYDGALKQEMVRKFYTAENVTNPQAYMGLYEAVSDGKATDKEIDAAAKANLISTSDWENLRKLYYNKSNNTENKELQNTMKNIGLLADKNFGKKQSKERSEFMYFVGNHIKGMTSDQALDYAKKQLEKIDTGWFSSTVRYKENLKAEKEMSSVKASLENKLGADVVKAIGLSNINDYASKFGGLDKMLPGTAFNNAVNTLIKKGLSATPANIQYVIDNSPNKDGKE